MEIITSSNCEKEHHRSDNDAAATNSAAFTSLKPNQSSGDFPIASCALANEIAAFIGAQSPRDAGALADMFRHWLSAAATETVATYKLSSAVAALAAVTTLAEAAVKAATDAAAAAAEHFPRMDYSLAEAGFLLSRGNAYCYMNSRRALSLEPTRARAIGLARRVAASGSAG